MARSAKLHLSCYCDIVGRHSNLKYTRTPKLVATAITLLILLYEARMGFAMASYSAWYSLAWSQRQTCSTYSTSSSMEDRHLILSISQVFCQETTTGLWRLLKHTLWYMKICHLHRDCQLKTIWNHMGHCYIWIWNWTKDCTGGWWMALNCCKDAPCIVLCSRYVTII